MAVYCQCFAVPCNCHRRSPHLDQYSLSSESETDITVSLSCPTFCDSIDPRDSTRTTPKLSPQTSNTSFYSLEPYPAHGYSHSIFATHKCWRVRGLLTWLKSWRSRRKFIKEVFRQQEELRQEHMIMLAMNPYPKQDQAPQPPSYGSVREGSGESMAGSGMSVETRVTESSIGQAVPEQLSYAVPP